jgi:heme oxygenase
VTVTAANGAASLAAMRAALRPAHDSIERSLDLMSDAVDLPRYRRFIERSYGFIAACERELDVAAAPPALDLERRLKTPLLRVSLEALGHDGAAIDRLPLCDRLPAVSGWPAALGYFYVIEGSTLGGQLLSRRFRAGLGVDGDALAFLTAYGADTGPMWKGMIEVLEHAMAAQGSATAITETARTTFELLERWHAAG